jgi:hypothetical protein
MSVRLSAKILLSAFIAFCMISLAFSGINDAFVIR